MHGSDGGLRYQAYVLRCSQERSLEGNGAATWRFSTEDPHTGMRRGCATWPALIACLQDEPGIADSHAEPGAANG